MGISDEGFIQDYELGREQELFIYCRLCRRTFPVVFRPKSSRAKLRCFCGYEAPLSELDVFQTEAAVQEHAAFYEKVYRAAKDALQDAGMALPPSGKYTRVSQINDDSGFASYYDELEDASAIRDGYIEDSDEKRVDSSAAAVKLAWFDRRLEEVRDPLARHEVLSELVTWTYVRRHFGPDLQRRFEAACREDIELAPRLIRAARERMGQGQKVRLSFASFKHLALALEEDGYYPEALQVCERAVALGLKGYAERIAELRRAR